MPASAIFKAPVNQRLIFCRELGTQGFTTAKKSLQGFENLEDLRFQNI
jgi:hypothetical protein